MKYEKLEMEVVQFNSYEFMAGSLIDGQCSGYTFNGHTCGTYVEHDRCRNYTWDDGTGRECVRAYSASSCGYYVGQVAPCWAYSGAWPFTCDGFTCAAF